MRRIHWLMLLSVLLVLSCKKAGPTEAVAIGRLEVAVSMSGEAGMPCIAVAPTRPQEALGPGPVFPDLLAVTAAAFSDMLSTGDHDPA